MYIDFDFGEYDKYNINFFKKVVLDRVGYFKVKKMS